MHFVFMIPLKYQQCKNGGCWAISENVYSGARGWLVGGRWRTTQVMRTGLTRPTWRTRGEKISGSSTRFQERNKTVAIASGNLSKHSKNRLTRRTQRTRGDKI